MNRPTVYWMVAASILLSCLSGCKNEKKERAVQRAAELRRAARKRITQAEAQAAARKKATTRKPAPKPTPAQKIDTASWPAEIRVAYTALLAMSIAQKREIIPKVISLARLGPAAKPALAALAGNGALPEPQRAMSAINYAGYYRYNATKLISLLNHPNPFMQREAAKHLGNHGGPAAVTALRRKIPHASSRGFARNLEVYAKKRPTALPDRANRLLDQLLNSTNRNERKSAAVVLAADFGGTAEQDLLDLYGLLVADKDCQMWAAMALTRPAEKSVEKLRGYTKRGLNKYLRYNAVTALGKLGAPGKAVLKTLLAAPGEPLKPYIEKLL
jgi:hypothetical protein